MDTLRQDVSYALRMLARNPGFTLVAVLTLGLGIGVNTAMFTVVNSVLLRPLPYPDSERLVQIYESSSKIPGRLISTSVPNYLDWKGQNTSFEYLSAYRHEFLTFIGGSEPRRVGGLAVPFEFHRLFGIEPILGRLFSEEETEPGKNKVILLGRRFWQEFFGADVQVLGRSVKLEGENYTVIGVLPSIPGSPFTAQSFHIPWVVQEDGAYLRRRIRALTVLARLRPGVALEQAQAEMDIIAKRLAKQYPSANRDYGVVIVPLYERTVGYGRKSLLILFGAVGCVLLIACANVANLLLGHVAARRGELAVRVALGAGRARILRQLMTEIFLLALLGSAAGLLLGFGLVEAFVSSRPWFIPRVAEVSLDATVLAYSLGLALLTSFVFGILPSLGASTANVSEFLKQGKGAAGTPEKKRLQSLLVITEVCLAVTLLAGAGLMARTFFAIKAFNPGFDTANLLTFDLSLPQSRYPDASQGKLFYQELEDKLESFPGVAGLAVTSSLPLGGGRMMTPAVSGSAKPSNPEDWRSTDIVLVSPNYFQILGVQIREGRSVLPEDTDRSEPIAVVSESLGRTFWPGKTPIGEHIFLGLEEVPRKVVGVAEKIKYASITEEWRPKLYLPMSQRDQRYNTFILRTSLPSEKVGLAIKMAVWEMDPELPVGNVQSMERVFDNWLGRPRFYLLWFGLFAALAIVIAAVGVYGVIAYSVSRRTHEIGVRMALGAQRGNILAMVLRQGMTPVAVGVGIGLLASYWLTRLLKSFLFEVTPIDPATFVVVSVVLSAVALLACYIPARRATKVDPMTALRYE